MAMMNLLTKRSREVEYDNQNTMATCLMLLSTTSRFETTTTGRVFECKTCNRHFQSFQALGGHRASHKKPKLGGDITLEQSQMQKSLSKVKRHECSICGVEFGIGQALGGHMRRHRVAMKENVQPMADNGSGLTRVDSIVNKPSKSVWSLDLNLTPMENDLEFAWGR